MIIVSCCYVWTVARLQGKNLRSQNHPAMCGQGPSYYNLLFIVIVVFNCFRHKKMIVTIMKIPVTKHH